MGMYTSSDSRRCSGGKNSIRVYIGLDVQILSGNQCVGEAQSRDMLHAKGAHFFLNL